MDIYYRKSGERDLRKIHIDKKSKIKTETGFFSRAELATIPKEIKESLLIMKDDEVLVIDNIESGFSDGIFKDNYHGGYTKIRSDYPGVFVPDDPDYRPGEKEAKQRFNRSVDSAIGGYYVEEREKAIKKGEIFDPSEEELALVEDKARDDFTPSLFEALSRLKSYRQLGIISPPLKTSSVITHTVSSNIAKNPERANINACQDVYELSKKYGHPLLIDDAIYTLKNTVKEELEKKEARIGLDYRGVFMGIIGEDNDLLSNPNLSNYGNALPTFNVEDNGKAVYEVNGGFVVEGAQQRDKRLNANASVSPSNEPTPPTSKQDTVPQETKKESKPIPSVLNVNGPDYAGLPKVGIISRLLVQ